MAEVSFEVRGIRPVPWGCNEWAWRAAIAASARNSPTGDVGCEAVFGVHLVFRMNAAGVGRADLDNLAKPVLDTLFLPRNVQVQDIALTGALFRCDDDRVFRLELQECQVHDTAEEGLDVRVTW